MKLFFSFSFLAIKYEIHRNLNIASHNARELGDCVLSTRGKSLPYAFLPQSLGEGPCGGLPYDGWSRETKYCARWVGGKNARPRWDKSDLKGEAAFRTHLLVRLSRVFFFPGI